jgi:thioesterase domain-containing protein
VTVPDHAGVADAGPDFAGHLVRSVVEAVARDGAREPLVVATHSNAGYFAPLFAEALERASYEVAALVFVDAGVPAESGRTDLAGEFIGRLRELSVDGVLPRWTDWWPAEAVGELVPDPGLRKAVVAEQPRLPLAFYEQELETGTGWLERSCGYVWFGEPYDAGAEEAAARGWPVRQVPGAHLHMVVEPDAVAAAMTAVAAELTG